MCMRVSMVLTVVCLALPAVFLPPQGAQKQKEERARADLPKEGDKKTKHLVVTLNTFLDLTATFHPDGEVMIVAYECSNPCKGKKHAKHSECDKSCDDKCPAGSSHRRWLSASYSELAKEGNGPPAKSHGDTLDAEYTKFGLPGTIRGQTTLDANGVFGTYGYFPTPSVTSNDEHWNQSPCSNSAKIYKGARFIVDVEYSLSETDDKRKINQGPKGTLRYSVVIPIDGTGTFTTPPVVNCKCEQTQTAPAVGEQPGHGSIPGRTPTGGDYAWVEQNGMRRPLTGGDVGHLISSISVPNMNEAFFTPNPAPWGPALIPAGWELECIDGSGQDVQLQEDLMIMAADLFPGLIYEVPQ